jgi:hypothetical protein
MEDWAIGGNESTLGEAIERSRLEQLAIDLEIKEMTNQDEQRWQELRQELRDKPRSLRLQVPRPKDYKTGASPAAALASAS